MSNYGVNNITNDNQTYWLMKNVVGTQENIACTHYDNPAKLVYKFEQGSIKFEDLLSEIESLKGSYPGYLNFSYVDNVLKFTFNGVQYTIFETAASFVDDNDDYITNESATTNTQAEEPYEGYNEELENLAATYPPLDEVNYDELFRKAVDLWTLRPTKNYPASTGKDVPLFSIIDQDEDGNVLLNDDFVKYIKLYLENNPDSYETYCKILGIESNELKLEDIKQKVLEFFDADGETLSKYKYCEKLGEIFTVKYFTKELKLEYNEYLKYVGFAGGFVKNFIDPESLKRELEKIQAEHYMYSQNVDIDYGFDMSYFIEGFDNPIFRYRGDDVTVNVSRNLGNTYDQRKNISLDLILEYIEKGTIYGVKAEGADFSKLFQLAGIVDGDNLETQKEKIRGLFGGEESIESNKLKELFLLSGVAEPQKYTVGRLKFYGFSQAEIDYFFNKTADGQYTLKPGLSYANDKCDYTSNTGCNVTSYFKGTVIKSLYELMQATGKTSVDALRGIEGNYIEISSIEDLDLIRQNPNGNFFLSCDIDLSQIEGWEPIGTKDNPFTGTIDGNHHKINGIKDAGGFINYAKGATFKNLILYNSVDVYLQSHFINNPKDCNFKNIKEFTFLTREDSLVRMELEAARLGYEPAVFGPDAGYFANASNITGLYQDNQGNYFIWFGDECNFGYFAKFTPKPVHQTTLDYLQWLEDPNKNPSYQLKYEEFLKKEFTEPYSYRRNSRNMYRAYDPYTNMTYTVFDDTPTEPTPTYTKSNIDNNNKYLKQETSVENLYYGIEELYKDGVLVGTFIEYSFWDPVDKKWINKKIKTDKTKDEITQADVEEYIEKVKNMELEDYLEKESGPTMPGLKINFTDTKFWMMLHGYKPTVEEDIFEKGGILYKIVYSYEVDKDSNSMVLKKFELVSMNEIKIDEEPEKVNYKKGYDFSPEKIADKPANEIYTSKMEEEAANLEFTAVVGLKGIYYSEKYHDYYIWDPKMEKFRSMTQISIITNHYFKDGRLRDDISKKDIGDMQLTRSTHGIPYSETYIHHLKALFLASYYDLEFTETFPWVCKKDGEYYVYNKFICDFEKV